MLLGDYISTACVQALSLLRPGEDTPAPPLPAPLSAVRERYLAALWADSSVDYTLGW